MRQSRSSFFVLLLATAAISASSAGAASHGHTRASVSTSSSVPMEMNVGTLLAISGGEVWPGADFGFGARVARAGIAGFYVGGDLSNYFHVSDPFRWAIAVLPAAYVEFIVSSLFHPRIGVSLGPVFEVVKGDLVANRFQDRNTVSFGLLFKPGVNLFFSRDLALQVEPRLGVVQSSFLFAPEIGMTIGI